MDDDWHHTERLVELPPLIQLQRDALRTTLNKVLKLLDEKERVHRTLHSQTLLESVFPDVLGYYFSKIFDLTFSSLLQCSH